jgi:hypothetical protein
MQHAHRIQPMLAIALAVAAAGLLLLGWPARAQAQVSVMLPDMLKNLTYPSEFTASHVAPLRDGVYDERAALGPNALPTRVTFVISSTSRDRAGVVLASSAGGSGTFYTLHLVRAERGVATAGPGIPLGDRIHIDGVGRSEEGYLVINLLTQGPGDAFTNPTKLEVREYLPDGNTFRLVRIDGEPPVITPPRTGNLGTAGTAASTLLLASIAALALPLAARRLIGAAEAA